MFITLHAYLSFDFSREIQLSSIFKPIFNYGNIKSAATINKYLNWEQINYFMCHDNWFKFTTKNNLASPSTVGRIRKSNLFELKIKVPISEIVMFSPRSLVSYIDLYVFKKLGLLYFEYKTIWYSSEMNAIAFRAIYVFERHSNFRNSINSIL